MEELKLNALTSPKKLFGQADLPSRSGWSMAGCLKGKAGLSKYRKRFFAGITEKPMN